MLPINHLFSTSGRNWWKNCDIQRLTEEGMKIAELIPGLDSVLGLGLYQLFILFLKTNYRYKTLSTPEMNSAGLR